MKNYLILLTLFFSLTTTAQSNFSLDLKSQTPTTTNTIATADNLQSVLYQLMAQNHNVQQAHWNVRGPQFESLHALLGEYYDQLHTDIDRVAERRLALGMASDGRPAEVAKQNQLGSTPVGFQNDYDVVKDITVKSKKLSDLLADKIESVGDSDFVTQDLLIDIKSSIDHFLWKFRSYSYN